MKNIRSYSVLGMPVITEKSTNISEQGQYCFEVAIFSNKNQIKKAVEHIFDVKVKAVNTLVMKGKRKIFKGHEGVRKDRKKAYVTLESGQKIDMGVGA